MPPHPPPADPKLNLKTNTAQFSRKIAPCKKQESVDCDRIFCGYYSKGLALRQTPLEKRF